MIMGRRRDAGVLEDGVTEEARSRRCPGVRPVVARPDLPHNAWARAGDQRLGPATPLKRPSIVGADLAGMVRFVPTIRMLPSASYSHASASAERSSSFSRQPVAIHGAIQAGARPEAVAGALGETVELTFDRRQAWALRQRDFMVGNQPGITAEEYEAALRRLGGIGIGHHLDGTGSAEPLERLFPEGGDV